MEKIEQLFEWTPKGNIKNQWGQYVSDIIRLNVYQLIDGKYQVKTTFNSNDTIMFSIAHTGVLKLKGPKSKNENDRKIKEFTVISSNPNVKDQVLLLNWNVLRYKVRPMSTSERVGVFIEKTLQDLW